MEGSLGGENGKRERMEMRDTGVERERMSREERGWKGEEKRER